jgi:hypothetical protein
MYHKSQVQDNTVLAAAEMSNYFLADGILEYCDEYLSRKWTGLFPSAFKALAFAEKNHLKATRASCTKVCQSVCCVSCATPCYVLVVLMHRA